MTETQTNQIYTTRDRGYGTLVGAAGGLTGLLAATGRIRGKLRFFDIS